MIFLSGIDGLESVSLRAKDRNITNTGQTLSIVGGVASLDI